jgi:hypothetical protein
MHELSIGEAEGLAWKATRASGYSWGVAQEAAFAVGFLEMRGLPGLLSLATLLEQTPETLTVARDTATDPRNGPLTARRCPITSGVRMNDDCGNQVPPSILFRNMCAPWLLVPFAARLAAAAQSSLTVNFSLAANSPAPIRCDTQGEPDVVSAEAIKEVDSVLLVTASRRNLVDPKPYQLRARAPLKTVDFLAQLAHATYVPATAESRLKGAGAGLTDND